MHSSSSPEIAFNFCFVPRDDGTVVARVSLRVPGAGDGTAWLLGEGDGRVGPGSLSSDAAFAVLRHIEAAIELVASSQAGESPAGVSDARHEEVEPTTGVLSRMARQSAAG